MKLFKFLKLKNALKGQKNKVNELLLPLQGAATHRIKTQGAALGYMLLPFQGALPKLK